MQDRRQRHNMCSATPSAVAAVCAGCGMAAAAAAWRPVGGTAAAAFSAARAAHPARSSARPSNVAPRASSSGADTGCGAACVGAGVELRRISSNTGAATATASTLGGLCTAAAAAAAVAGARRRQSDGRCRSSSSVRLAATAQATEPRKLTERQEQFWEMLQEDLEEDVVPEFGRDALDRVYEFIKYCKYEKEIPELPELQEIDPEYFPGLRAKPWWDPSEIDGDWVAKVKEGLPYVQGELADLLEEKEEAMIADSVQNKVMGEGWSGFRLQRLGDWLPKNCEQFPQTVQLLQEAKAPLAMRGVIVARQVPGSGVLPHSDGRNIFLTAHFGLSIPEDCDITVGGVTTNWIEDEAIILDTSFVHSTRNSSEEDRFVLIVDFWHPDLTVPEREALEFIYDFRTKFEQGKIKYVPKMPTGFFETLEFYSAWGGAYTEEKVSKRQSKMDNTLGGFSF